jgi:raffinose/stachyose/melibiose transport system substrate-binding protein
MQDAIISSREGRATKRGPLRLGGRVALAAGLVAAGMVAIAPLGAQAAPSKAAKAAKAASFATNCGTKKVTLQGYFETGFNDIVDLTKLFTKQHPTVKWHIREDQFATITSDAPLLLAGPNAPDLMRMPQLNGLVKDHLLKDLDGYFKTFDWSKFPGVAHLRAWVHSGRWARTTA